MRIALKICCGVLCLVFVTTSLATNAQEGAAEVLTNQKIEMMVKAGLDSSIIINKIHSSKTSFNTNTDELIRLKQIRVPAEIINAMVEASGNITAGGAASGPSGSSAVTSGKGVFVQLGGDWKRIEEVSSIEVRSVGNITSRMTLGIKESRVICVFRGETAELRLSDRRPKFRISGLGASVRDVYIVALRLNPDRRDLEMGRAGLIKKASFGFRKRDIRDVEVKRLGEDLLEATPRQDLEPGEYIMVLGGVSMARSNSAGVEGTTGYDFGIVRAQ
jgi:hypothetical protein